MNGSIVSSSITTKTFCSTSSNELWILTDDQIEKIPYLTALVSSAEYFESSCDEYGHYKLDPSIQSNYFSFALHSFSFKSVRQIFTHLPKQNDIMSIIAHFDFLGIAPHPNPTFEEIDAVFFSNIVYKPSLNAYIHIIRPFEIQDMAVRFAFALAKGEYDLNNSNVIDQIYWFVMFIQSAYELFGPRLRHHIYRIAEYCFSLFSPNLLKPLRRLLQRTQKGTITVLNSIDEDLCFYEEEQQPPPSQSLSDENHSLNYIERPMILEKSEIEYSPSSNFGWYYPGYFYGDRRWRPWFRKLFPDEDDLLKPIRRIIIDTVYERLQNELCKSLRTVIHQCQFSDEKQQSYRSILLNILKHKCVQEEINERIAKELYKLKPKLESTHTELVIKLREYEQKLIPLQIERDHSSMAFFFNPDIAKFEECQNETLIYKLLLEKIYQYTPIIEQIRQDVIQAMYKAAKIQIKHWQKTHQEIIELQRYANMSIEEIQ